VNDICYTQPLYSLASQTLHPLSKKLYSQATTFFTTTFFKSSNRSIGFNMADEEEHPDSSGKEVRAIFFTSLFHFEGDNIRY
jgi:hypothetical protein